MSHYSYLQQFTFKYFTMQIRSTTFSKLRILQFLYTTVHFLLLLLNKRYNSYRVLAFSTIVEIL